MGVRILKRAYGNAYAPSNEPKPDWLIGNVGDWIRLNMEVEAGVDFLATQQSPVTVNKQERSIKLMNGKKWSDYGFDLGADTTLIFKVDKVNGESVGTESFLINFEIEQLFGDTLIYVENEEMNQIPFEMIPTDRGITKVYNVKFFDDREIEGIKVKYANVSNEEVTSHSLNSFIDSTETELIFNNLKNITQGSGWQDMVMVGYQSGMSIEKARIKKLADKGDLDVNYDIPYSGNTNISIPPNQKERRQSIAVNVEAGADAMFKNSSRENYGGGSATPSKMFLYDSNISQDVIVKIKTGTVITNNYNGGGGRVLILRLTKWKNGSALEYDSSTDLAIYQVTNSIRGQQLTYDDSLEIHIGLGESLSLDYIYYLDVPNLFASPSVDFYTNFGNIEVLNTIENTSYKKKYEVEIDFMLSSFFEEITDLDTKNMPDVVFNENSLTDAIKVTFLPEWNNPNIKIENDMAETEKLGNTGWFNENYNGLENNFKVDSIEYFDMGGQSVTALSFGAETRVRAVISGIKNLSNDSDFKHGFIWLPIDEAQYKNKKTPFHKNTKINSNFDVLGFNPNTSYPFTYNGYSEDGARMDSRAISYTIDTWNNVLIFEAVFSPTNDFLQMFENRINDRKYSLWVSVADSQLETPFSDRVSLILDVNNMDYFIPISGELEGVINSFIEHPEDENSAGVAVYNGFLEDDILARSFFNLKVGQKLNAVTLGFEVENTATKKVFELERFTANLQSFPITQLGIHEIDFNAERGYKLVSGNNKNWVKINRYPDGDKYESAGLGDSTQNPAYKVFFGQKIRWEYWLQKSNVPTEFYNNSLPFNGNNNDWLHFLRNGSEYRINFFLLFDIEQTDLGIQHSSFGVAGTVKRFKNAFEIKFNGYDENLNIVKTHQYFDNENNNLLNIGTDSETGKPLGVILSNKNTRIEITYEKQDGNFDLNNVYAVTTIEIDKGAGVMEHRQLSSVVGSEVDNILIPLPPNGKLKVELIAPNKIKTTCLVDHTKLGQATRYKITGRLGCFANENGVPLPSRIYDENDYELNYE